MKEFPKTIRIEKSYIVSLYLCIFNDDEEVDGVDVGAYSDFAYFRKIIAEVFWRMDKQVLVFQHYCCIPIATANGVLWIAQNCKRNLKLLT